jgi:metal-dependent hydrolase (beta-lactamase superfamily II)
MRKIGARRSVPDFVVMSHRHGGHIGGMAYLLRVNARSVAEHRASSAGRERYETLPNVARAK